MCPGQPLFDDTDDIKDLFWKDQRQYSSKTSLSDLKKVLGVGIVHQTNVSADTWARTCSDVTSVTLATASETKRAD